MCNYHIGLPANISFLTRSVRVVVSMCGVKAEQQTGATLAYEWVTHLYI